MWRAKGEALVWAAVLLIESRGVKVADGPNLRAGGRLGIDQDCRVDGSLSRRMHLGPPAWGVVLVTMQACPVLLPPLDDHPPAAAAGSLETFPRLPHHTTASFCGARERRGMEGCTPPRQASAAAGHVRRGVTLPKQESCLHFVLDTVEFRPR